MKNFTYVRAMGDDGAHIRLKLDNSQPITLSNFVGEFVGIGNQFEKFIAREYPDLTGESEFSLRKYARAASRQTLSRGLLEVGCLPTEAQL
jgi:hypothetical protein